LLALDFLATASGLLDETSLAKLVKVIRVPVKAIVQVGEQLDDWLRRSQAASVGPGLKRSSLVASLEVENPPMRKRRRIHEPSGDDW